MKKIVLFLATTIFAFASCNSDDDNNNTYKLNANYLKGIWTETAPEANYILNFDANTAKLTYRHDSSSRNYNYSIQDSLLNLRAPENNDGGSFEIEIVNRTTFRLTSLYPQSACDICKPIISTFKKQ